MKELSEAEMLHRAAAYCSGAERCISDVEKKIMAAGLDDEASKRIIKRLLDERFIDEKRYARFFVNDKFQFNKWGKIKINYELQKKKISSEIREESLSALDEEAYNRMLLDLLKAKKKTTKGKNDADVRMKLIRFAAGRGFEMPAISFCLRKLGNTDCEDEDFFE